MSEKALRPGMSPAAARLVEWAIIGLCIAALFMIFQPFSLALFSWGCGLVVLGGLAFNLVPLCRPGTSALSLLKVAGIILLILLVAALLGIGTAKLYTLYLGSLR
ncbi:MAG: hypothetical protein KDG89_05565 [Geminicoccaceae bacterium]|nr:hypothetical protein [Geminicoccaceae bacterium]